VEGAVLLIDEPLIDGFLYGNGRDQLRRRNLLWMVRKTEASVTTIRNTTASLTEFLHKPPRSKDS